MEPFVGGQRLAVDVVRGLDAAVVLVGVDVAPAPARGELVAGVAVVVDAVRGLAAGAGGLLTAVGRGFGASWMPLACERAGVAAVSGPMRDGVGPVGDVAPVVPPVTGESGVTVGEPSGAAPGA